MSCTIPHFHWHLHGSGDTRDRRFHRSQLASSSSKAGQQMIFFFVVGGTESRSGHMANWLTFQLHVFLRSFQINLRLSSLHGMRSEIKCAFNVMQVKLLSYCSGRLQLHKVNESNDVYKNMRSCCSKWDDDYGEIREHNKCKTAVIRLHQRTDSHLSHEGGFSLFAAIAVSLPEAERGIRFCGEAVRGMDVAQWKLLKC